jgi:transcription antitermination factor NusG
MREWYCARTHFNAEFVAKRHLEQQGFVSFLPTYLIKDKQRHIRIRFLFKGYIFIALDEVSDWPKAHRTIGVHHLITYSPGQPEADHQPWYLMPSPVGSRAIAELYSQLLSMDEIRKGGPPRPPKQIISEGCHVKILSGIFKDEEYGRKALVHWSESDRAGLLMRIFNREVVVEFYHKDLELVPEEINASD